MIGRDRPLQVEPIWAPTALATLADAVTAGQDWRADGNCAGADWRLFEPPDEHRERYPYPPRAVEAARYCHDCPVIDRCRRDADTGHETGVWAGQWRSGMGRKYRAVPIVPLPDLNRRRRRVA